MMTDKHSNFNENVIIKTLSGEILWDGPINMNLIDVLYNKLNINQKLINGKQYIFNFIDVDKNIYKSYDLYYNKEMFVKYNNFTIIIVENCIPITYECCGPRDNGCKYDGSPL